MVRFSNSAGVYVYVNSQLAPQQCSPLTFTNAGQILIGAGSGGSNLQGTESNIQIYNTSPTASEVQGLYTKGMGGAPLDLTHLVGWWPLNGDTKDYSGNSNNGPLQA